jgi:hypothetical protein
MAKESKSNSAKPAAKKTTTKSAAASKPKAVSKKTTKSAVSKATTKSKKPAQSFGSFAPMVDTNLAAEAAARMLATRAKLGKSSAPSQADAQRESGSFKQMKESINKPAAGGIAGAMGNTFGPSKSNLPNPEKGPVVRDQTTSSVNRVNVPRRTGG